MSGDVSALGRITHVEDVAALWYERMPRMYKPENSAVRILEKRVQGLLGGIVWLAKLVCEHLFRQLPPAEARRVFLGHSMQMDDLEPVRLDKPGQPVPHFRLSQCRHRLGNWQLSVANTRKGPQPVWECARKEMVSYDIMSYDHALGRHTTLPGWTFRWMTDNAWWTISGQSLPRISDLMALGEKSGHATYTNEPTNERCRLRVKIRITGKRVGLTMLELYASMDPAMAKWMPSQELWNKTLRMMEEYARRMIVSHMLSPQLRGAKVFNSGHQSIHTPDNTHANTHANHILTPPDNTQANWRL